MDSPDPANIANEDNRDLYNQFITIAVLYEHPSSKFYDEYRGKALRNSANIIANHQTRITCGADLNGCRGIGKGTINRINEYFRTGMIAMNSHNRMPKRKIGCLYESSPSTSKNDNNNVQPPIDLLVPASSKYKSILIQKDKFTMVTETTNHWIFRSTNSLD
jgi:hypothetical protein